MVLILKMHDVYDVVTDWILGERERIEKKGGEEKK
jgi:hypothetical protein